MTTKFYKCETCGNVVVKLVDSKVPLVCCGSKMQELVPNTVLYVKYADTIYG